MKVDTYLNELNAIFDNSVDAIIIAGNRGIIERVNNATCKLFGYERQELLGQNLKILMDGEHKTNHDQYLDNYQRTRVPRIIGIGREVEGRHKQGNVFPCRLAVSEVILHDRVVYTGTLHDLSEVYAVRDEIKQLNIALEEKVKVRTQDLEDAVNKLLSTNRQLQKEIKDRQIAEQALKERELELIQALEKEKELGELKSRFVALASHEFRTPLTTIQSSSSLIAKYDTTEQQEQRLKHIDRIKSNINNLVGILNDFLSLSKLEEGSVGTEIEAFDLKSLLDNIKQDLQPICKANQEIVVNNTVNQPITTDRKILKNILFNLLSNAIKYSSDTIDIILSSKDDHIIIAVKDNGMGIPKDEQKYLFDRFFRAKNVNTIQGTGLGLNIVRRYVSLINGSISFESEENVGTTFTLTIPLY